MVCELVEFYLKSLVEEKERCECCVCCGYSLYALYRLVVQTHSEERLVVQTHSEERRTNTHTTHHNDSS